MLLHLFRFFRSQISHFHKQSVWQHHHADIMQHCPERQISEFPFRIIQVHGDQYRQYAGIDRMGIDVVLISPHIQLVNHRIAVADDFYHQFPQNLF